MSSSVYGRSSTFIKIVKKVGGEVENPGLVLLRVKEVVEYDGGEKNVIEIENHNDSIEEPERVEDQLVEGYQEVGGNFFKEVRQREAETISHLVIKECDISNRR